MTDNNKVKEILQWILDNSSDIEAMDKISNLTYPYTSKYQARYPVNNDNNDGYYPG